MSALTSRDLTKQAAEHKAPPRVASNYSAQSEWHKSQLHCGSTSLTAFSTRIFCSAEPDADSKTHVAAGMEALGGKERQKWQERGGSSETVITKKITVHRSWTLCRANFRTLLRGGCPQSLRGVPAVSPLEIIHRCPSKPPTPLGINSRAPTFRPPLSRRLIIYSCPTIYSKTYP